MSKAVVWAVVLAALLGPLDKQTRAQELKARVEARIFGPINDRQLMTLRGNTHRLAQAQYDAGAAPASLPMERMLLVLTPSAAQQAALETLLEQQQDKRSPQFHRWLTPEQFGQQFGASDQDVQKITAWLESHGLQVARVSNGRNVIEFSGTAGQVEAAFHTAIHKYVVNGEEHWANASDPQIPAALAAVVAGVATLHNFSKQPQILTSGQQFEATYRAGERPQFTASNGLHALAPGDYATIYNISPLYDSGVTGAGMTIAVVGRTNINAQNIVNFRNFFGLPDNPPRVVVNGADPGDLGGGEEAEAVLDTTWSGGVAPNATVKLVVSKTTNTSDGVDLSEEYIIDHNLGDVMTESFGGCEAGVTQAEASFYTALAAQAAAQGITYVVAAGDSGAEGCDLPTESSASGPLSVNLLSSNPYVTAVGGTEFNEGNGWYWETDNFGNGQSALSYIPEVVWNESCAAAQCGSNAALWSGGGGASTIYSKPSWQSGVAGILSDGSRDVPDVSLTAAGHDPYLLCVGTNACVPNATGRISLAGYSGTSAATPSFAGIMALVDQETGGRQGNANYVLYALAAKEPQPECSTLFGFPDCVFIDITVGNNAVPGEPGYGTSSALYPAHSGYDLATGLGSMNVSNLVNHWVGATGEIPHIHMQTDVPGSVYSTFTGTVTFSGWALEDVGAIDHVTLAIDEWPMGEATYGATRPDVCNSNSGRVGCPNVGWSFPCDTTLLTDGAHTLEVTATSVLGQKYTTSSSFTVANWQTSGNPITIHFDTPNAQSGALSGVASMGGWAIDNQTFIEGVALAVDNVPVGGQATYGWVRMDVCNASPNPPGCPEVGWTYSLNTALLADGPHTLDLTAMPRFGEPVTKTTTFTVKNLTRSNPIVGGIDTPAPQSGPFNGTAQFDGWALDKNAPISSVKGYVDGVSPIAVTDGAARPDVCNAPGGAVGCPDVGWTASVDTTGFANGPHTLEVTAYPADGTLPATFAQGFTIANVFSGSTMVNIDVPNAQNSAFTGVATFSGWATDPSEQPTLSILIDGAATFPAVVGIARPEVCAAEGETPGCPNVGWSLTLDTNLLADGPHALSITASIETGGVLQNKTVSAPFTVANWTTANPTHVFVDNPRNGSMVSGTVVADGWAVDDEAAITGVWVAIDDLPFGPAVYGSNRADVCNSFPNRAGCPNVGWAFSGLDTTALADGTHTLDVTVTTSTGRHTTLSSTFTVANTATSAIQIVIDQPTTNQTLSGQAQISGWAIDSGAVITGVAVEVDGVEMGAANYGENRQDVCSGHTGISQCPNVGWTLFDLDTTRLGNGAHILDIRAVASNGEQATRSTTFQVSNQP